MHASMVERLAIDYDQFSLTQHGLNLPWNHAFQSAIKGGLAGHSMFSRMGIDPAVAGASLRLGRDLGEVVMGPVSAGLAGEFGTSDDGGIVCQRWRWP